MLKTDPDRSTPLGVLLGILGVVLAGWLYLTAKEAHQDEGMYCKIYASAKQACFSVTRERGEFDQDDDLILAKSKHAYALAQITPGRFFIGPKVSPKNVVWTEEELLSALDEDMVQDEKIVFCEQPGAMCE